MSKVKLRSAETVEEVDWLLGGGMSAIQICEAMQSTFTLEKFRTVEQWEDEVQ